MTLSNNNLLTMYTFMLKLQCMLCDGGFGWIDLFLKCKHFVEICFFHDREMIRFVISLQQDVQSQSETQNIVWLVCNFNKIQNNSDYGKFVETFFEHAQASTSAN